VGVSGGRDSVALLHWLIQHGYSKLIVCHLDHSLRGNSSRADARFVQRLATNWNLPYETERADVSALAKATKQSLEAAGRAARLSFFSRVGRRRRCLTIFLGHHADDQVETILLKLVRGAGARGLGAMREISQFGSLRVVRPMLGVWRAEIDAYIAEHGLEFREDASNAELGPRRNLLRHKIIPELEKRLDRSLRHNLWRAAAVLTEESALLDTLVPNDLTEKDSLVVKALSALPLPLQRRAIQHWLKFNTISDISYEAIERVRSLLEKDGRVAKINLSGDRHARRRSGKIFLE
jgi:tRNA(Ile)-lysidine synthase